MKREGVSTLFIHSYLWALSCLLYHLLCLKVYFVVVFKSIFEKRLRLGKHCNHSRLYKNVYKSVDPLKMSSSLKDVFESVGVMF